MEPDINFAFDGKRYTVSSKAFDLDLIILPDGRAIQASGGWLESYPPQPVGLVEVPHLFQALNPDEIAIQLNGVVAEEVVS